MPDIGFGEIVAIVVVALLVFGPDRLPKVAADAARTLRQVRQMAASARKDLVDAAGLEDDGEMAQAVRDIRDLDPRRTMQGVLNDAEPTPVGPAAGERAAGEVGQRPTGTARGSSGSANEVPGRSGAPSPVTGSAGAASAPLAPPVMAPAPVDPDWT